MITFEIPGRPHAKQRARSTRTGRHYTPNATVNAETFIRLTAAQHFAAPWEGPVALDVLAVFEPAASWSKAKRGRLLGAAHVQRPDLDNVAKSVCDGMNGVAFADDAQIADFRCRKVWGPVAKTIVTLRRLEERF